MRHRVDWIVPAAMVALVAGGAQAATVDRMDTHISYTRTHQANAGDLAVLGTPQWYYVSDGTQWYAGAGTAQAGTSTLVSESTVGGTLRFEMTPTGGNALMNYTDYDSGSHSSQGVLGAHGPLVIEATPGATTATIHGYLDIVSNDITWYGEPRFNYYSAPVGSWVPFDATYTLVDTTWHSGIFGANFQYLVTGHIDFTQPVPEPSALALLAAGAVGLAAWRWRTRAG
jgi:hypothetical protein